MAIPEGSPVIHCGSRLRLCRIDALGRVAIPHHMREASGLPADTAVAIYLDGGHVFLTAWQEECEVANLPAENGSDGETASLAGELSIAQ